MKSASKCKDGFRLEYGRVKEKEGEKEGEREREREGERADEDRFFMTVSDEIKACIL